MTDSHDDLSIRWEPPLAPGETVILLAPDMTGDQRGTVVSTHELGRVVSIATGPGDVVARAAARVSRVNVYGERTWPCCTHCDHDPLGPCDTGHTVKCEHCPAGLIRISPGAVPGWTLVADTAAELVTRGGDDKSLILQLISFAKGAIDLCLHMGDDGPAVAVKTLRDEIARLDVERKTDV